MTQRSQQTAAKTPSPTIHVRFDGRSTDIPRHQLDLGRRPSDADIRDAVAHYFSKARTDFNGAVIDRHTNGNITLRPAAVYG